MRSRCTIGQAVCSVEFTKKSTILLPNIDIANLLQPTAWVDDFAGRLPLKADLFRAKHNRRSAKELFIEQIKTEGYDGGYSQFTVLLRS